MQRILQLLWKEYGKKFDPNMSNKRIIVLKSLDEIPKNTQLKLNCYHIQQISLWIYQGCRSPKEVAWWKCAWWKNITEGENGLLLSSIAKIEHSPTNESYQSNVCTGEQSCATATVNNEGSSWGTPWAANDSIILKVSNPEKNKSSHMMTNDFKILLVKVSNSVVLNENKSKGKVVT